MKSLSKAAFAGLLFLLSAVSFAFAASTVTIPADVNYRFLGNVDIQGQGPITLRSRMQQETLATYPVDLTGLRVWDAYHTVLPGTSATDDLGLVGGTWGTGVPSIETYDVKAAGATTLYARFSVELPVEYVASETVEIRVSAGMVTTVADTTCTVDFEAYESNRDGTKTGSDLITTAATDMNSLTFSELSFTVTDSGLSPGDVLDVRMAISVNDAATGTEVKARIGAIDLQCDIKG